MRTFKVGQIIWRGHRSWVNLFDFTGGTVGWNTTFIPYRITGITAQRIKVEVLPDSINGTPSDKKPLFLKRGIMELAGKQYHTRFHEYFYAEKPKADPERRGSITNVLNLTAPFTADDVNRQYKQLARKLHPDAGGTDAQFIELQRARDEALRLAMPN